MYEKGGILTHGRLPENIDRPARDKLGLFINKLNSTYPDASGILPDLMVRSSLRSLAEEKGLDFKASVDQGLPEVMYGDAKRITQCLLNLAANALKFTKQGGVSIVAARDRDFVRYSVSDTGIGIPHDQVDAVFTEFKQVDATITREFGGTGLGLSITKKFVEMHGGRIWVESRLNEGSTFHFTIPLKAEIASTV